MADISKLNGIELTGISKLNGVDVADIDKLNDQGFVTVEEIVPSGSLTIDNQSNPNDSITVDVTPDSMNTSLAKYDTGDGTSWFKITSGATETGDFTLTVELFGVPPTSNKDGQVEISDDSTGATTVYVNVHYNYFA